MKTIKRAKLSSLLMGCGGKGKPKKVILEKANGLRVMNYVGIGWVDEGEATEKDKKKYPLVVD